MGDLQSPQYVKRTAHMFDSRYNNGDMNGSSPISRSNGNGVTSPTPGQPSYLRVSQSVSGYSCLSYSSNSGASPTPGSNGTSHVIKSPIPLRPFASPDVSISSKAKLTSATRHKSMPEDPRHEINGSSTYQYKKTSSYLESSPEPESRISSYRDGETPHLDNGNGINNYTQNRCKSNILEKIERLYGANAVKSTSLWRRPVPSFQDQPDSGPTARKSYPPHGLPSEARRNETNNMKGNERIIPILVEDAGLKTSNGNRTSYERDIVPDRENGKQALSSFGKVHNISYPQKQVKHDRQDNDLYSKYGNLSLNREDEVNECEQENRGRQGHFQCSSTKVKSDNLYTDTDPSNKSGAILREENRDIKRLVISTAESPKLDTALPPRETLQPSVFSIRTTPDIADSETSPDIVTQPTAIMTTDALSIQSNQKTEGDDVIDGEAKLIRGIPTVVPAEEDIKIPVQTTTPEQVSPPTVIGDASKEIVPKGGEYFLKVVSTERLRIQKLIDEGEIKLAALESDEGSSDSELSGKIWAAIGKAKLLINKKFKQFEGLCNDNIKQTNEGIGDDVPFTTKNEDLEGFWDMVCIQIDQIHEMFRDLDSASPAEIPSPQKKPQPKKPTSPTKSGSKTVGAAARTPDPSKGKNAASAARDELRRKMLAEKRRAMKDQVTKSEEAEAEVQIFTPDA